LTAICRHRQKFTTWTDDRDGVALAPSGSRSQMCNIRLGLEKPRCPDASRAQVSKMIERVRDARERLNGVIVIDFVVPDIMPTGRNPAWRMGPALSQYPLPATFCPATRHNHHQPVFDNVRQRPLRDIWQARSVPGLSRHRTGCPSPAAPAIARKWIGAVAAARPSP